MNATVVGRPHRSAFWKIIAPANAVFKTTPTRNTYEGGKPIEGITMLEADCRFKKADGKVIVRMSSRKL